MFVNNFGCEHKIILNVKDNLNSFDKNSYFHNNYQTFNIILCIPKHMSHKFLKMFYISKSEVTNIITYP